MAASRERDDYTGAADPPNLVVVVIRYVEVPVDVVVDELRRMAEKASRSRAVAIVIRACRELALNALTCDARYRARRWIDLPDDVDARVREIEVAVVAVTPSCRSAFSSGCQ